MEITYNIVKNIFDTLPVGYYLGRNIDYSLSETETDSYFDPINDKIVISYIMIYNSLKSFTADDNLETVIRGLLYHEVSHVILSPANLKNDRVREYADQINIVEDERIETLCRNLYMNVNFKRNIVLLNNYDGELPKSPDSAFYHLVRYHKGPANWINRLTKLLKQYRHLSAKNDYTVTEYQNDIISFYKDFIHDYSINATKINRNKPIDTVNKIKSNSTKNLENDINITAIEDNMKDNIDNIVNSINELNINDIPEITKDKFKELANSVINKYYDPVLEERLSQIISSKLKKKALNGSAINAYSGRLNVRSVGTRDDYRWWSQQNRAGHIKQFSKVHFNLFIDNSGSFMSNDKQMNTFIRTLDRINNSDFSFDVITINTKVVEWPNHKKLFSSTGGNRLRNDISKVIKRHQLPATNNYNIVLFDGDAHSDDYGYMKHSDKEPFSNFDSNNTIIISDSDNRKYIEKSIKKAQVQYVSDYCNVFINTICDLLERAL